MNMMRQGEIIHGVGKRAVIARVKLISEIFEVAV